MGVASSCSIDSCSLLTVADVCAISQPQSRADTTHPHSHTLFGSHPVSCDFASTPAAPDPRPSLSCRDTHLSPAPLTIPPPPPPRPSKQGSSQRSKSSWSLARARRRWSLLGRATASAPQCHVSLPCMHTKSLRHDLGPTLRLSTGQRPREAHNRVRGGAGGLAQRPGEGRWFNSR